jgi:hypothetical protein
MTLSSNPGYPGVSLWTHDEKQHRRDMARTINNMLIGKMNVTLDVTLNKSATSTTIIDARIGINTAVIPAVALTSDAAQVIDKGVWVDTILSGSAVVHHSSAPQNDLTIRFVFIG